MSGIAMISVLGEWTIRATGLIALVASLLFLFRIKNVHIRLTVWTLVLVGCLFMPILGQLIPPVSLVVPTVNVVPSGTEILSERSVASGGAQEPTLGSAEPQTSLHLRDSPWISIAAALWILGVAVMLSRLVIGLVIARRILLKSEVCLPGNIRVSSLVRTPATLGVLRPVVFLPGDWHTWPAFQIQAVIAHECEHVRRLDPLRQFLASVYRALSWFNPMAWWLRSQIVQLSELAADDVAIARTQDRRAYAETLLRFLNEPPGHVYWVGAPMASRASRGRRFGRILDANRPLSTPHSIRISALIAVCLCPFLFGVAAVRALNPNPDVSVVRDMAGSPTVSGIAAFTPPPLNKATAVTRHDVLCGGAGDYANWLKSDIAYLISGVEKEQFLQLRTRTACAKFVDEFWRQRDPDLSTVENEFREEHRRRVEYANASFGSDNPGWQTDRGRFVIVYGQPDSVTSYPIGVRYDRPLDQGGGSTSTYPFEKWHYRRVDGIREEMYLEFVDSNRKGHYRLAFNRNADQQAILSTR